MKEKNVQRLNTVYSDSFISDIQELVRLKQEGRVKKELVQRLSAKYGITEGMLYWRVRSYYGKTLREARWDYFEPSKESLLELVSKCHNAKELRERVGMPESQFKGIYDRVLGVSTFHAAKLLTLDKEVPPYSPSVRDNVALIAACRLGDGGFVQRNGKFHLSFGHCLEQKDWLSTKRSLLIKSFPWMAQRPDVKINKRGHAFWYAGTFQSDKYNNLLRLPKEELVDYLTPLGIWVLYLDDGCYLPNHYVLSIAAHGRNLTNKLANHFRTYGYNFAADESRIKLSNAYDVKRFMLDFCEPFAHLTPECMKYKTVFRTKSE